MKKTGRWMISVLYRVLIILLIILLLPYARILYRALMPDRTGEIRVQSEILRQKLESSKRLEVTVIEEEGTLKAETSVIIFGTVGSTTIRYRYTASIGIDLSRVLMTEDQDRIIFTLPDPQILNDGIEALEVNRNDFFSKAIDKSVETLLNEQRLKCREEYLSEEQYAGKTWDDTVKAFNETICSWLDNYGERHCEFEFLRSSEAAAPV